jgi:putative tryptophan/tyrosine transport system substrate-binding protein
MRRRDFITVLAGATAWAFAARAQEPRRVIGFLSGGYKNAYPGAETAFLQGLKDAGLIEGGNIIIEWHWAEGQYGRLPLLAGELLSRNVAVIVAFDAPAAFAAKAATRTTPIVFLTGADPVATGLVESFSRPGGNLTGVSALLGGEIPKRLEILHELVPSAVTIASLVNPGNLNVQVYARETQAAAKALGLRIAAVEARTEGDLEAAFTIMVQRQAGALVVMADPFFIARREQIIASTNRCAMPAIYPVRWLPEVSGLMSYGASPIDLDRQMGIYTGKILKGAKAGDIPIQQSTRLELVINVKSAKMLGLTVPPELLARADEVIE